VKDEIVVPHGKIKLAYDVGRALWLKARSRLAERRYKVVTLWVLADNERAVGFYLSAGFAPNLSVTKQINIAGKSFREIRYELTL
jgi:hypothetical protein